MRHFTCVSFFLLILSTSLAQIVIEGKVVNQTTKEPIPFANIGVFKSNVGTLSNLDGTFSLRLPDNLKGDSVLFSSIGFEKKSFTVEALLQSSMVYLTEKSTLLKEIVVRQKAEKPKIIKLGNPTMKGGTMQTDTLYAGRSISLLIDNKNPQPGLEFPLYIQKASLRILRNNLKAVRFRLRILEMDASGLPGQDLLHKNIIIESSLRNGWLDFDLSELNFVVQKPFFLTFEQLTTKEDRIAIVNGYHKFINEHPDRVKYDTVEFEGKKSVRQVFKRGGIDIPGTFIAISHSWQKFTSYVRETSFGEWNKVRGIVTATVTLSNQRKALVKSSAVAEPCSDKSPICETEKICNEFLEETGLAGMQIGVAKKGKIEFIKSFGFSDVKNRISVNDSTKFRIASISKSITSAALVKLASEGKLDLDAPVQKYLPQFPEKKYEFTTRQLAGHLAGFRDYKSMSDYVHHEHYDNAIQALKVFQNDTLLFKPGTKFHYSTFSWRVIGAIVENIGQQNYLTYMNENIFVPLRLNSTCGDNIATRISNRSKFYDATGQENEFGDVSYMYAGGGLLSTAVDLVKFGEAMLHQTDEVKKLLFTSQKTSDGLETGYGLGWYVGKDKNGHRIWHHSGDLLSASSHLLIYPDDDLVLAFVANGQEGAAFDMQKIAALFYEK